VLQVQRMSTEDGPGLRTTAFLKGCPLACEWCHNPESISPRRELQWIAPRCVSCGACVSACAAAALARGAGGAVEIDRGRCALGSAAGGAACPAPCSEACPSGAMEALGSTWAASELARELRKDSAWFASSVGGGVTLSGGEASAQRAFSASVLRSLKETGLCTALDTCGYAPWELLAELYRDVDLVLYDLKEIDDARHRAFTGVGNALILDNLRRTAELAAGECPRLAIWVRTPIVPGATDSEENLRGLGAFLRELGAGLFERWELCAFNNLCADKYRALGIEWKHARTPLVERARMEALAAAAAEALGEVGKVSWTGTTR
jgi:pyruvate formate lyase activating enzyme